VSIRPRTVEARVSEAKLVVCMRRINALMHVHTCMYIHALARRNRLKCWIGKINAAKPLLWSVEKSRFLGVGRVGSCIQMQG
jgi:hypothetical protein